MMTDAFFSQTFAELQDNHNRVSQTSGQIVDENNIGDYLPLSKLEVSPRNNDWNGFLDPSHTVQLQFEDTSAGTRSFPVDTEIAPNIYVTTTGDITFSDTGWSWLAGQSIYKLYTYTVEQLSFIDESSVPVYIVDEVGGKYFINSSLPGVSVTKTNSTTLKVEITSDIFTDLGITKVWEFFSTDSTGYVRKLNVDELACEFMNKKGDPRKLVDVTSNRAFEGSYQNNTPLVKTVYVYCVNVGTTPDQSAATGFGVEIDGVRIINNFQSTYTGAGNVFPWVDFDVLPGQSYKLTQPLKVSLNKVTELTL